MTERRLLVTGFEPFGAWKVNPSLEVIKRIDDINLGKNYQVKVAEIPVEFKRIGPCIIELLNKINPSLILHLGQSGHPCLYVERVALNIAHVTTRAYNCGSTPDDHVLIPDGPAAYFATIPVQQLVNHLISKKIPAKMSYHAGTYGCNQIFFHSLNYVKERSFQSLVGLIHVPSLPTQVVNQLNVPSMSFDLILKGIHESLNFLVTWMESNQ